MTRYLVVANQTLGAAPLLDRLHAAAAGREASFYLVVPATPPRAGFTWTEGHARSIAEQRLRAALGHFRNVGLDVAGEVGDPDPMLAVEDALRHRGSDVIVLSTLPVGISRWLGVDLPQRMRSTFPQPVLHVVSGAGALVA
jgi:GABA permease